MCELNATALCINRGGHRPEPTNKTSVSAAGDLPVQNGKTDFTLSATATFQPGCSPPMTVVFSDVTVTDTTNGLTHKFPGAFRRASGLQRSRGGDTAAARVLTEP